MPDFVDPPADTPHANPPVPEPAVGSGRILPAGPPHGGARSHHVFRLPDAAARASDPDVAGHEACDCLTGSLSGHFVFALTLTDTALLVGLVIFFLRAHHESPCDVLLGWRPVGRELTLGIALIPLSFFVVVVVLLIVGHTIPVLHNVPHNPLQDLAHTGWMRSSSPLW